MHLIGLDRPTPRGSKPIRSNLDMSAVIWLAIWTAKSKPEPPGPPGLSSTEPAGFWLLFRWMRMSAMSIVLPSLALPSFAVFQLDGTVTVPQEAVMLRGKFGLILSASDWQDFHWIVLADAPGLA